MNVILQQLRIENLTLHHNVNFSSTVSSFDILQHFGKIEVITRVESKIDSYYLLEAKDHFAIHFTL